MCFVQKQSSIYGLTMVECMTIWRVFGQDPEKASGTHKRPDTEKKKKNIIWTWVFNHNEATDNNYINLQLHSKFQLILQLSSVGPLSLHSQRCFWPQQVVIFSKKVQKKLLYTTCSADRHSDRPTVEHSGACTVASKEEVINPSIAINMPICVSFKVDGEALGNYNDNNVFCHPPYQELLGQKAVLSECLDPVVEVPLNSCFMLLYMSANNGEQSCVCSLRTCLSSWLFCILHAPCTVNNLLSR